MAEDLIQTSSASFIDLPISVGKRPFDLKNAEFVGEVNAWKMQPI